MKTLSIRQPWAWAIIHGGKDVENRSWQTKYRGRILIHAAIKFDMAGYRWIAENENRLWIQQSICQLPAIHEFQRGGIIGSVEFVDCVPIHGSLWFQGPYGFVLKNPEPLPFRPCKGRLGLFTDLKTSLTS